MLMSTTPEKEYHWQWIGSIILSMCSTLMALDYASGVLRFSSSAQQAVSLSLARLDACSDTVTWADLRNFFRLRNAQKVTERYTVYLLSGIGVFLYFFVMACIKLYMKFHCPDSLFNMGPPPMCVDITSVMKQGVLNVVMP